MPLHGHDKKKKIGCMQLLTKRKKRNHFTQYLFKVEEKEEKFLTQRQKEEVEKGKYFLK